MAKKFTFADAKLKIKELEEQVEALNLNTDDHVYTTAENNVIKFLKVWGLVGPALAVILTAILMHR
jgi:hypothetical protein|tara:strand:- start:534 stop:731 length:198 start_codon:yes stop_codon:yes gene_type:complete